VAARGRLTELHLFNQNEVLSGD